MKTNTKSLVSFFSLLIIVLIVLMIFGIRDIRMKEKEVAKLSELIEDRARDEDLIHATRGIRENYREHLETLEEVSLTGAKLVPLIEKIEETGRKLGLEVRIFSVDELEEENAHKIKIDLGADGEWAQVFSLLRVIESLPEGAIIEDVSFAKNESQWNIKMSIFLYSFE
jgi:hypothetical protein